MAATAPDDFGRMPPELAKALEPLDVELKALLERIYQAGLDVGDKDPAHNSHATAMGAVVAMATQVSIFALDKLGEQMPETDIRILANQIIVDVANSTAITVTRKLAIFDTKGTA